jgi:hypothetical protein
MWPVLLDLVIDKARQITRNVRFVSEHPMFRRRDHGSRCGRRCNRGLSIDHDRFTAAPCFQRVVSLFSLCNLFWRNYLSHRFVQVIVRLCSIATLFFLEIFRISGKPAGDQALA